MAKQRGDGRQLSIASGRLGYFQIWKEGLLYARQTKKVTHGTTRAHAAFNAAMAFVGQLARYF